MHLSAILLQALAGALVLRPGVVAEPALQEPLHAGAAGAQAAFGTLAYDDGLFTPMGDLSALSSTEFTRLTHPAFPRHSVRAKKTHFCDGSVQAYTGYIDVEAHHLFWFFFESRRDPDADDIIFWTNGGPGGSGSIGLFMELGPCRVTGPNTTERNPWSWNEHANTFFIEQPVDVGFSYAEYGESVSTTREAADDVAALMAIFFEHFPKFKGRGLHLAGESYGGRYIPAFASAIYDKNAELVQAGVTPINLTSIMIGNGCTDFSTMFGSYYDAQCADPIFPPIQDISTCVRMKQLVPRCEERFKKSCVDTLDKIDCAAAAAFCFAAFTGHYKNPWFYDRARSCTHDEEMEICFPILNDIQAYLSQPSVQELLGVDLARRGNYSSVSKAVGDAFDASLDWYSFPAHFHIGALLERGVRALIFVGANDFICNWIGNDRMTLGLEWTQQDAYRGQPLSDWLVDGKPAGITRSGGGLTFATITGGSHMAPYDRPVESLELVNRWLASEPL